jgi:hypothetical protein
MNIFTLSIIDIFLGYLMSMSQIAIPRIGMNENISQRQAK